MTAVLLTCAVLGWAVAAALLRRASVRSELVARAAHELRGPLAAAQLALDGYSRRGDIAFDRAAAIDGQLRRARLALDDLSAASEGRRAPDTLEPVPMTALLAQLQTAWRPAAAAHRRDLRVAPAPLNTFVLADRTRLAQAGGNLVANALEHGAGAIDVSVRVLAGCVRLEVRDDGDGLPASIADLARRRRGGRGRGLAISAGIAARHGGRLSAAPSAGGAALELELPVLDQAAAMEALA